MDGPEAGICTLGLELFGALDIQRLVFAIQEDGVFRILGPTILSQPRAGSGAEIGVLCGVVEVHLRSSPGDVFVVLFQVDSTATALGLCGTWCGLRSLPAPRPHAG